MVSAGLPRASSSRSDVDESSGPSQQDSVAGTSNQHSTQPSTGSGSYLRQPSGRPKLHLKPPLADLDDQTYFVQAPAKPNPPSEVTLPQANVGQKQDMGHVNPETHRESQDRWWTFTLPADAVKKADRYWRHTHDNSEAANGKGKDPEKHNHEEDEPPSAHLSTSMSARISGAFGYSASSTPWMAPWTPFKGPATQLERGLTDPDMLHQHTNHQKMSKRTWLDKAQTFFLYSAFAPFWCRFINLSFTATVLGLAGKIYVAQTSADFEGLLGVSTVLILVIGPLSILHIFGALFFEYFGAPIGIAAVSVKMAYTLLDLLFVALWSAVLAVTFDDYFTSNAQCTSWTPYAEWRGMAPFNPNDVPDYVCDLQLSLLVLNFFSVLLYQGVLIISLFRIFEKVSRKAT